MSHISSIQRVKLIPVFLGMVVLASTVALKLVGGSDAAVNAQLAVSQTMHAVVHQNNDIFLTFDDGSAVTSTIPAGTYTVRVVDQTSEHNFHLVGPGVDVQTGTGDLQNPTWVVTLQNGAYRFVCDNHADFMFGIFSVSGSAGGGSAGGGSSGGGSSGGGSTGGGSSGGGSSGGGSSGGGSSGGGKTTSNVGSASVLGTLAGTVDVSGKLKLLYKGKAVSKLKAGKYKITVVDKTAARSFLVQQAKRPAITVSGVPFVGSKTATVTLKPGQWSFFTSAGPASKTSFTVS